MVGPMRYKKRGAVVVFPDGCKYSLSKQKFVFESKLERGLKGRIDVCGACHENCDYSGYVRPSAQSENDKEPSLLARIRDSIEWRIYLFRHR